MILQLIAVMWGVGWMSERWPSVTPALTILSFVIVVWLVRKYDNPTYKITWIIIILLFPLFGGLFYLFWGNTPFNRARTQHQYEPNPPDFTDYMRKPATEELSQLHPRHAARTRYIDSLCGMPGLDEHGGALLPRRRGYVCFDVRGAGKGGAVHLSRILHH